MSDYDNTNSGALFKNKDKNTEKHPDYKGTLNVGGEEFWISSWLKVSKAGEKYMSLSVTPKEASKPKESRRDRGTPEDMDSDIPF